MVAWKITAAGRGCHHFKYLIQVPFDYENRRGNARSALCFKVKYYILEGQS